VLRQVALVLIHQTSTLPIMAFIEVKGLVLDELQYASVLLSEILLWQ
jgi:hypothetical protein